MSLLKGWAMADSAQNHYRTGHTETQSRGEIEGVKSPSAFDAAMAVALFRKFRGLYWMTPGIMEGRRHFAAVATNPWKNHASGVSTICI